MGFNLGKEQEDKYIIGLIKHPHLKNALIFFFSFGSLLAKVQRMRDSVMLGSEHSIYNTTPRLREYCGRGARKNVRIRG